MKMIKAVDFGNKEDISCVVIRKGNKIVKIKTYKAYQDMSWIGRLIFKFVITKRERLWAVIYI